MASTLSGRFIRQGLARNNIRHLSTCAPTKIGRPSPHSFPAIHIRRYAANNSSVASDAAAANNTSSEGGAAGKIFFSSLCLLTFGLGVWQTQRYSEKVEMVQKREDDLKLDPLPGFDDWQALKNTVNSDNKDDDKTINNKSYRRVNLQGKFQHDNEILVGPRGPPPGALAESGPNSGRGGGGGMSSSAQGYWVVTPFVISNYGEDTAQTSSTSDCNDQDVGSAKQNRGWFGRFWGKKSKSTETTGGRVNLETKGAQHKPLDSTNEEQNIVWINRGWIPRHYISNKNEMITSWDQPKGTIHLMAMESNTETPRMFSPPSRLDSKKAAPTTNNTNDQQQTLNKLLWMDRNAMEEIMNPCSKDCHPPLFVELNTNESTAQKFPVKPTREYVGEFKVTPEIHAGYAVTWFGLSGPGMVMTRKLLRRGR
ncbi:hypothetical protein ACHAXR_011543 [Thalassiosira sp. AJA248-18]